MADDGGVLENLPRSRPGRRSAKRSATSAKKDASGTKRSGAKGASRPPSSGAKAATRAEERGAKASEPAPGATARNTARPKPAAGSRRAAGASAGEDAVGGGGASRVPGGTPLEPQPSDPVGDALRVATSVAAAGARVAQGVAREVLRRLPRP